MSTPTAGTKKPVTRSNKKITEAASTNATGSSPVLTSRKRKPSVRDPTEESLPKKMADNQILEAINGIKASVTAMEKQLKAAPTKEDIGAIVNELRGVKEKVIRNTDRIDTLFDLRKEDNAILS